MANTVDLLIDKPEMMSSNGINGRTRCFSNFRSQWKQWLASLSATLSMVAVGTVYGWTTTLLPRFASGRNVPMKLTDDEASFCVALTVIASMFGSLAAAFIANIFGRKICLLSSGLFFIAGWLTIRLGDTVMCLYAARFVLGIGVGMAYTTNPMYFSEVGDTDIRGALGTLISVNVYTGSLLACSVGPYVSYTMFTDILLVISILFVVSFTWFPESPYYLAMKNRQSAAIRSIMFFKSIDADSARSELEIVLKNINEYNDQSTSWRTKIMQLFSHNNPKAFFMVFGLIVAQQLSGNFTTMQYLTRTFEDARIGIDPDQATIIVFAVGLISGTFCTLTVDRAGRRILLIISTFFSGATLAMLAVYLCLDHLDLTSTSVNILPVVFIVWHQVAYQIGLGTLPNALIGELFPTSTKNTAAALLTISDGVLGFIVSKYYLAIETAFGNYSIYFFFASSCFVAFIFVIFCIPETRNKSFGKIQEVLSRKGFYYNRS